MDDLEELKEDSSGGWLPELYRSAGLAEDAPLSEVQEKMGTLANLSAPAAKSWIIVVVLIQGFAVIAPTVWLIRRDIFVTPIPAALIVLASVGATIGVLWWMRWRGMQRTWARARLIAEVARARSSGTPAAPLDELAFLFRIPELQTLLEGKSSSAQPEALDWPEERDTWIDARLDDQLEYYRGARKAAVKQREEMTRTTTLVMDVMLSLAVAATIFVFSDRSGEWLHILGGRFLEITIGFAGIVLALSILLLQILRYTRQLNQRAARFARQIAILEETREAIHDESDPETGRGLLLQAEQQMLGEVVDWFYEAETAEDFFRVRSRAERATSAPQRLTRGLAGGAVAIFGGIGLFFLLRIVLGRAPWVLGASAVTLMLLSLKLPDSPSIRSGLQTYGEMVDAQGRPWKPDPAKKEAGLIVIAHGLRDGVLQNNAGKESKWMRDMHAALQNQLTGESRPNIVLVNWDSEASPTKMLKFQTGLKSADMLADVASIRTQAREVGDSLAFRLFQLISEGKIDKNAPIQFIGHSAGGFVVCRAAMRLREMGVIPESVRVTILDTPGADSEVLEKLPELTDAEFYITSPFVVGLFESKESDPLYIRKKVSGEKLNPLEKHSYAHQWYLKSIRENEPDGDGFDRSPFASSDDSQTQQ